MSQERIYNVAIAASGSGTDANAVMTAGSKGQLHPRCKLAGLISTVRDAGCLEKATALDIFTASVVRKDFPGQQDFEKGFVAVLTALKADILLGLGCIHMLPVPEGIEGWNIHPAHTRKHGGTGLYGLEPHASVLAEICQDIIRGFKAPDDRFFTHPTFHEMTTGGYDQGVPLMTVDVEIPRSIIELALQDPENLLADDGAAAQLQKVVLPHEHLMLPAAVNLVVQRMINRAA